MVLGGQRVVHAGPDRIGRVEVIARQDHRPVRQPCNCLHQKGGRPARGGGPGKDHRIGGGLGGPLVGEPRHRRAQHGFGIRGLAAERLGHDAEEGLGPRPVGRVVGDVQPCDAGGVDTFALHLLHQRGQAVGQIVKRGAGELRAAGGEKAVKQDRQFQPPAQGRDRAGQRDLRETDGFGDKHQPGKKQRALGLQTFCHPAAHPLGVDDQHHPRQRFGRLTGHASEKPLDQFGGEIDAGGQGVEVRLSHLAQSGGAFPPPQSPRGGPRRTSHLGGRSRRRYLRRSFPSRVC